MTMGPHAAGVPASPDPIRAIADAVLYEGYLLWPYRRSALKNRRRWTFGGVHPRTWSERHPDDSATMQTQLLIEGDEDTAIDVRVRFLQVVDRSVAKDTDGQRAWVGELELGGERHLAWEEARERELALPAIALADEGTPASVPIELAAGSAEEELLDSDRSHAGALVRSWQELRGSVRATVERVRGDLARVTVTIENTTPWAGEEREQALRRTLCSTHAILHAHEGQFVSMTDPPAHLREHATACRNLGTWPVLVGEAGTRETVLSSPIILEDYPRVAPESPGDLFDGGEIDQLLVLNILALSDEEKEEMRASDPRAREILERTEALSGEEMMRLHGAIRELRVVREC